MELKSAYAWINIHTYHLGSNQPILNQLHNRMEDLKACSQGTQIVASPAKS